MSRARMTGLTSTLRRAATLLATALTLTAAAPTAAHASTLALGFNDRGLQEYAGIGGTVNEPALNRGLQNIRAAGGTEFRVMITWSWLAPGDRAPQPAAAAGDPAWPGYRWAEVDRLIKAIVANGLTPIFNVYRAATWAEARGRPEKPSRRYPAGSWKPDPVHYQHLAEALGQRYSGQYPDPAAPGTTLPAVPYFHGWNEPNLYEYLNPQWERVDGKWQASSVRHFRTLTRAFSRGIRKHNKTSKILLGPTAPFGGLYKDDPRIPPARFMRELLCVKKKRGKLVGNRRCAKLDIDGWSHHTYPIGPPWRTARNEDDVVVPDMGKLTKIFDAAAKAGTISRKAARDVWMTEMSWESAPDPDGLSLDDHAFYMQGAFFNLWRSGVRHILWWNSRDMARGRDWNTTHQSGIFARGSSPFEDVAKPSFTAFRFPFAAYRNRGVARLWTKPPADGPVTVEAFQGGQWRQVATLRRSGQIASGRLLIGPRVQLRARVGEETSFPWRTF